jgi:MraZ protein
MGQKPTNSLDLACFVVVQIGAKWGIVAPDPTQNMPSQADIVQKALVFSGEFRPVLDQKKRLTIPARWRPDGRLEELFIVKSPSRGCLAAMPQEVLEAMGEKAAAQAPTVEAHQAFMDQFFASALICPVDSQGRMVLADELCRFARIDKEVVLAGSGMKFDIWNPEAWEQQRKITSPTYETILKSLGL